MTKLYSIYNYMILALTSFGFGVCAFVAAAHHDLIACGMLMLLAQCSILHHSHGTDIHAYTCGKIVGNTDRILARNHT